MLSSQHVYLVSITKAKLLTFLSRKNVRLSCHSPFFLPPFFFRGGLTRGVISVDCERTVPPLGSLAIMGGNNVYIDHLSGRFMASFCCNGELVGRLSGTQHLPLVTSLSRPAICLPRSSQTLVTAGPLAH